MGRTPVRQLKGRYSLRRVPWRKPGADDFSQLSSLTNRMRG